MSNKINLHNMIHDLQECQTKKGFDSCMKCDLFLKCNKRKDYVLATYQSMNEDMGKGGFDFN